MKKYDWNSIQEQYNSGLSTRDLIQLHKMSSNTITKAVRRGDLITRNKSDAMHFRQKIHGPSTPVHSAETREKISQGRTNYLRTNPDKVPYVINHSSNESYPEKIFRNALTASGITGWVSRYRNGIYQYDFAFVDLKIDVEIDGDTHTQHKVKKIDSRRDNWSKENGWTVVRFTAKEVREDVISCINKLKQLLY